MAHPGGMMTLALILALMLIAAPAQAQVLTISSPGTHTLSADVSGPGVFVVHISVNNVVLDLNNKTIRCTPGNPATATTFGVAAGSLTNVVIRNGSITGCMFGINAGYGTGIILEDLNLSGNTYIGANLGHGVSNIVRRVTCANIGGYSVEAYAICINGTGDYGLVEDSTFTNIYRQAAASGAGEGIGILIEQGAESVIARRNVHNNAEIRDHTYGMWSANGGSVSVSSGQFTNAHRGLQGSGFGATGNTFRLTAALAGSRGVDATSVTLSGNTFIGYETAWMGGIADGGGNIIQPLETTPPPQPPPTLPNSILIRVCLGDGTVCYEGVVPRVPGG